MGNFGPVANIRFFRTIFWSNGETQVFLRGISFGDIFSVSDGGESFC